MGSYNCVKFSTRYRFDVLSNTQHQLIAGGFWLTGTSKIDEYVSVFGTAVVLEREEETITKANLVGTQNQTFRFKSCHEFHHSSRAKFGIDAARSLWRLAKSLKAEAGLLKNP